MGSEMCIRDSYNSVVKKGQLIAEMDKVTLQAELESQEAQLANAKAEYEYQQKNYARSKVLFEKQLISDSDYEEATYNYEKAKSTYEKSKADIVKVRRNLGYAVITSPIDGVVSVGKWKKDRRWLPDSKLRLCLPLLKI